MKDNPNSRDAQWENLLRQARTDTTPPTDVPALLHAVRMVRPTKQESWLADFSGHFALGRMIPTCVGGAAALMLFSSWQLWDAWQTLPWAQLYTITTGGAP
jgi:hypothetical protein